MNKKYHAYLELYQISLYENEIRTSFMNSDNIKPFPWYNILYECTNVINRLTFSLENEYEKLNGPIIDDYQNINKNLQGNNNRIDLKGENNFSIYNNRFNSQYETPYNKMKNPATSRLSTIRLKQYIRENYPNITPKRVYEYLMNTPSIHQFKRKLVNTPKRDDIYMNQKRDLFNAKDELERREREREKQRENYYYNNNMNNNINNERYAYEYRRNSSKYNDDYYNNNNNMNNNNNNNFNNYMYNKNINSQNPYFVDPSKKFYDYSNKENMIPNQYSEYNINNIHPYTLNNRDKLKNNMNFEHYSTYQRNKLYNEPDSFNNENLNYYNPIKNYDPLYNEKERYNYETSRKGYNFNSYDDYKSELHPPPNTNQDFYNKINNDINYEEYLAMKYKKNINKFYNEGTFQNDNPIGSHFTEEYNKSMKSFIKPITVRSEAEISFYEYLIKYFIKINVSWKIGNYLFNTSINRYVSILIPDIQLQQWAIQILGNLVYFSLVNDKQYLIKNDLGNIIECLIRCLISIELFIKSPPIPPTKKELPTELDIIISVLQSTIYKITLSYYNEIKQLKLSPRIYNKLQFFLDFKE
ncbi:hypothetical protein BCR32DRAFT_240276 [Anaeromyces robustus]|uniref:Uncharacterized protein n=1 Tax=Anaeromyces robustus TaxID=1754192 RepID=A0A1Y1XNG2_9FUNG|nr:hypothetical protein BCR32DRAFT_240276 [Anaeromyces robustus]|eukprot:ORX87288.1 hypothetical protein BCR32DRAFT_240276 [Anaeromyces robustus]